MNIFNYTKTALSRIWQTATIGYYLNLGMNRLRYRRYNMSRALASYQGWVYAAAKINSDAFSSVPLRLYRVKQNDGIKTKAVPRRVMKSLEMGDMWEEVTDNKHPALSYLKSNPYWDFYALSQLQTLYLELAGNAYFLIDRQNGCLWPLQPDMVWAQIGDPNLGEPWITGYWYGQTQSGSNGFLIEDTADIIHFKYQNPNDLVYGRSKLEAAWSAYDLFGAKRKSDIAWFQNMARPDYIAIAKSGSGRDELRSFEDRVNQQLRGPANAGRIFAMTGDVTFQPLNFAPKDANLSKDEERIVEEISVVFGVPRDKLLGNATYANSSESEKAWRRGTIDPMLRLSEGVLNSQYLPSLGYGDDYVFSYDKSLESDQTQLAASVIQLVTSNIITRDEAREELGYTELTEDQSEEHEPTTDGWPVAVRTAREKNASAYATSIMVGLNQFWDNQFTRFINDVGLAESPARPVADVESKIRAAIGEVESGLTDIEKIIYDALKDSIMSGYNTGATMTGKSKAIPFAGLLRAAASRAAQVASSIASTTASVLRTSLDAALKAGATVSDYLDSAARAFSSNRANDIAQNESSWGFLEGERTAFEEAKVRYGWQLSASACPLCQVIARRQLVDGVFAKAGETITAGRHKITLSSDLKAPPLHPNCKCDLRLM